MADFVQTMNDWKRMCASFNYCEECPMEYEDEWASVLCSEGGIASAKPEIAERVIAKWAEEHLEPVYPTWGEWFVSRGMLPEKWDDLTSAYMNVGCVPTLIHSHIPADIAEKLGIEPKEG